MIVYNVTGSRNFYSMKADAEAERKHVLGLPPEALNKIEISHRDELAAFLTALCRVEGPMGTKPMEVEDTSWIPDFVKRDWERRKQYRKED